MVHECKRCGYTCKQKNDLIKHFNRKTPCKATNSNQSINALLEELKKNEQEKEYKCTNCGKGFTQYQNRWRHQKSCNHEPQTNNEELHQPIINDVESRQSSLIQHTNESEEITKLKVIIEELQSEMKNIKQLQNTQTYNITNNITQNNNIQVHLKDLGQENTTYLPIPFITSCFVNKDIVKLLENIHCDKDHPENHNIRVKSQKRNQIELRENERWVIKNEDKALTECIKNGYRILTRHGYKHKKAIIEDELDNDEDEYYNIRDWLERVHDNVNEQKPIKTDLLLVLLSNRDLLLLGKDK